MVDFKNFNLFGIKIKKNKDEEKEKTFIPPPADDGAVTVTSSAFFGSAAIDVEGVAKNEIELITRYREMAMQPELETAIEDIVNEAIVRDNDGKNVRLILDNLKQPDKIKKLILNEFESIERILNYNNLASDIFRRFYVDGRLYYQLMIDTKNPEKGIVELRYIDPRKIKKVRQIKKIKNELGVEVIEGVDEYYLYNDRVQTTGVSQQIGGVKIAPDSIIYVNSGLLDPKRNMVLSYLHKCIKPLNQLRMIEDASVIYKICLVGDTRIKTPSGWKYIKDIQAGDIVYDFNINGLNETKVTKQWLTATKQTFKVSSKYFDITGTDNHPILVLDKDTNIVEYVDIKNLVPKKHCFVYEKPQETSSLLTFPEVRNKAVKIINVNIFPDLKIENKEQLLKEISYNLDIKKSSVRNFVYGLQYLEKSVAEKILEATNLTELAELAEKYEYINEDTIYNIPEYIDEEFARLFGFFLGDGVLSNSGLTFAEGIEPELNEFYANILRKYFGNCNKYSSKRKFTNYQTHNRLAKELFEKLEFTNGAHIKRLPSWIYNCDDEIKIAMILGFADADGHIIHNEITDSWSARIELCNKQLVEDIKELWTSLGYGTSHIYYRKRASEERCIGNEITFRAIPERESWHIRITNKPLPRFDPILEIKEAGVEDVYDIEVESEKHNFIANAIPVHNSRSPQRRVFYIDVGGLPPVKAEQYVRDMMTKYKNKITYDACLDLNTEIPLLDGRTLTISQISKELSKGKELWAYSCDPKTGEFAPGLITWAGQTKSAQKVMRITFDNDKSVVCTPDHKFPIWNKGFVEAKDLLVGESMIPLYGNENKIIIKSSEYLEESMDVGTLTIDRDEIYHDFHTFGLVCGVYTKNSTGELTDSRRHLSMLEDFWFPRKCLSLNTKIKLLDGRDETLETLIDEYNSGKQNWVYSVSPEGIILPGKISWAGITKKQAEVVKITLDNGYEEIVTPDHKFILLDGILCEAQNLTPELSLMSFDKTKEHKIIKVEKLDYVIDTGTLTIDENHEYHNFHNFALSSGIFVKNSDGRATEVTTLQSTDNFNDMSMVEYFQKALYKSLNVPVTRLDPSQAVSIGRSMEITRDELKFSKFIDKIRKKFTELFYQALRVQLVLKGICTDEEWKQFKEDIYFEFTVDNNFVELKEYELYTERLNLLTVVDPFVNKYFSPEWVQKNILRMDDKEIAEMEQQMEKSRKKDLDLQIQNTDNQVKLQARSVEMQQKLGLIPPSDIDANDSQETELPNGQPATQMAKNNPYNVGQ